MDNFFGKNLKYLRDRHDTTQQEIADLIGRKSTGSISDWEAGRSTPNAGIISKIAKYYDIKIDDLVDSDLETQVLNKSNIHIPEFRHVPLIGTIACGDPITAEENIEDFIPTIDRGLPKGDLFYLRAKGDSMEPVINSGSKVLCRAQEEVETGEIAAVLINGETEATLKKVRKTDKYILLEAINDEYAPYIVDKDNPARIIGKAIQVVNDL